VNRWDLEEHLLDDTAVADQDDEDLELDHRDAHRVGQLIWRPHEHQEA
jgi:hypothetical protein